MALIIGQEIPEEFLACQAIEHDRGNCLFAALKLRYDGTLQIIVSDCLTQDAKESLSRRIGELVQQMLLSSKFFREHVILR